MGKKRINPTFNKWLKPEKGSGTSTSDLSTDIPRQENDITPTEIIAALALRPYEKLSLKGKRVYIDQFNAGNPKEPLTLAATLKGVNLERIDFRGADLSAVRLGSISWKLFCLDETTVFNPVIFDPELGSPDTVRAIKAAIARNAGPETGR